MVYSVVVLPVYSKFSATSGVTAKCVFFFVIPSRYYRRTLFRIAAVVVYAIKTLAIRNLKPIQTLHFVYASIRVVFLHNTLYKIGIVFFFFSFYIYNNKLIGYCIFKKKNNTV